MPWKRIALIACALVLVIVAAALLFTRCARHSGEWQHVRATIAAESKKHFQVSLGFAGDTCFVDDYIAMEHLAEKGSTDIADGIDPRFIDIMRGVDLMWINNEFCYSNRGEPLPGKMYTFRSKPENVRYLHELGVDIVGLANNHVFDYGEDAFLDTLVTLEDANVSYVGAGRNLSEAKGPVYLKADGFTIAYVAASSAEYEIFTPEATDTSPGIMWCYDNAMFLDVVREAAANADYVVALPHWGVEHSTVLESAQTDGAHALIDAGADAVIGAHTHIMQGMEYYQGKPIVYSLGNFWFDDLNTQPFIAELKFTGDADANGFKSLDNANVQLIVHVGADSDGYTTLVDDPELRNEIYRHIEDISVNVAVDDNGVVHEA